AGLGDHLAQPRARSLILSHARIPARPGAAVRAVPASRWTARERGGSVALGGSVEGGVVARLVDARPSLPVAAEQLVVGGAGPDRLGHHGSGDAVGAG